MSVYIQEKSRLPQDPSNPLLLLRTAVCLGPGIDWKFSQELFHSLLGPKLPTQREASGGILPPRVRLRTTLSQTPCQSVGLCSSFLLPSSLPPLPANSSPAAAAAESKINDRPSSCLPVERPSFVR